MLVVRVGAADREQGRGLVGEGVWSLARGLQRRGRWCRGAIIGRRTRMRVWEVGIGNMEMLLRGWAVEVVPVDHFAVLCGLAGGYAVQLQSL